MTLGNFARRVAQVENLCQRAHFRSRKNFPVEMSAAKFPFVLRPFYLKQFPCVSTTLVSWRNTRAAGNAADSTALSDIEVQRHTTEFRDVWKNHHAAAVILLGSTALASAQTLAFPRDRAYDGYGWSYGGTGPSYSPRYGVAPAATI